MPNYSRVGPWSNNALPSISATFLNAIENVFEQPSGGSETGKYYIDFASFANAAKLGPYMQSISRTSTPVSVTTDSADTAPTNCGAQATAQLSSNGFVVYVTATGVFLQVLCGGNFTINY